MFTNKGINRYKHTIENFAVASSVNMNNFKHMYNFKHNPEPKRNYSWMCQFYVIYIPEAFWSSISREKNSPTPLFMVKDILHVDS